MFKLLRYFSITSLVSILVASVLMGVLYRQLAVRNLLEQGEAHNVDITRSFANALWPQFSSLVAAGGSLPPERLKSYPEIPQLHAAVQKQARGLAVAKIKVWDLRGRVLYSSELSQIGDDGSRNAGVITALSGKVASELVYKNTFSAFEQTIERANLISTYMPMRRPGSGEIDAVFELYDDVTPFVKRIEYTQKIVVLGVMLVFSALYGVLFFIVRRADRLIQSQEARLQRTQFAVDMASDLVFWLDKDGHFIYANDEAVRRLGYRRQELMGMTVSDVDRNLSKEHWPETWEAAKREQRLRFETRYRTRSGEECPVDVTVSHVRFQGEEMACAFARDISERKRMEAELEGALAEMRVILDNALVGIVFIRDGRAVWVNARFEELFGYGRDDLPELAIAGMYRSIDVFRELRNELYPRLQRGMVCQSDLQLRHKSGRLFWCSVYGKAIDSGDLSKGSIWILQDISERKRAESDLVRARDAAEAASRTKAEFLANMSHELLTPMNGILAMTDLTLADAVLSAEVRENLETVRGSANALLRTLQEILRFSEMESGRSSLSPSVFVLPDLLAWELKEFVPRAEAKGIELGWHIAGDVPRQMFGDADALRQVIHRLVDNAVKFTERGQVKVAVSQRSADANDVILHVAVEDTGIGIAPERIESVFGAFNQADTSPSRRYGGTGLGLPVSARLVRLMGGRIWAVSEEGKGTTVFFTVPMQVVTQSGGVARAP